MLIKLFDIQNGKVVPTSHCYTLKPLKDIMDNHPDDYLQIYSFIFYMTCPSPELNPFFNTPEYDKEEIIYGAVDGEFSLEDPDIIEALKFCLQLYQTPTYRAYMGIKAALDKLGDYMFKTSIEHGRDGNINSIVNAAAKFDQIRNSYKGAYKDLADEQKSHTRGGQETAYDQ